MPKSVPKDEISPLLFAVASRSSLAASSWHSRSLFKTLLEREVKPHYDYFAFSAASISSRSCPRHLILTVLCLRYYSRGVPISINSTFLSVHRKHEAISALSNVTNVWALQI